MQINLLINDLPISTCYVLFGYKTKELSEKYSRKVYTFYCFLCFGILLMERIILTVDETNLGIKKI